MELRVFFPTRSPGFARAVCEDCPVRLDCLEAALNEEWRDEHEGRAPARHGIRGGLNGQERRALLDWALQ